MAGDGSEGVQAVFEARNTLGSTMAFAAFDVLELDGVGAMREPWTARRKRLEDLLGAPPPGICLVPVADDAPALWDAWVGIGREGIVLKERTSPYRSCAGALGEARGRLFAYNRAQLPAPRWLRVSSTST